MNREQYDQMTAHMEKEAANWPSFVWNPDGPEAVATSVRMIPATIAEQIAEKYLVEEPAP